MQQMMRCLLESLHCILTDDIKLFIRLTEGDRHWVALEDSGRTGHLYGETNCLSVTHGLDISMDVVVVVVASSRIDQSIYSVQYIGL